MCQKSKIDDWIEHFKSHYNGTQFNLTNKKELSSFIELAKWQTEQLRVGVINYELAFRRKELLTLRDYSLVLDESSLINNEQAKRSKFIMKLNPTNTILLSGTLCGGKYEKLWSQLHLLGWNISKDLFWRQYVDVEYLDNEGFPIKVVKGYKNVDRLKQKMRIYGCRFLKTEDVFDLPEQIFNTIRIDTTKEYRTFKKDRVVTVEDNELVGDTTLTKMLYERQLCGSYNANKLEALKDLLESSDDRIIIFYNFNEEARLIVDLCEELDRPYSVVNGKGKDLNNYENFDNSVTLIQYQAGSLGLNLQKANKTIYFTPPLSCEFWMQSAKRTNRIGQSKTCFYYKLVCRNSIEEKIYKSLEKGVDYTDRLFEEEGE